MICCSRFTGKRAITILWRRWPAGEKRAANLVLLLQRALEYAGKGNHGIFSFVRYIESMKKSEIDFGEASLTNEGMNAVRIMSIHKSKGLEFPVVFLAGTARQFNQVDARGVVKDNDYGMGIVISIWRTAIK